MGGTCTTGWKLSLENGSSFGRRQRWGIEAPTKTHLIVIMMVLRVVSRGTRELSIFCESGEDDDKDGGGDGDKGEGGDKDDSPTQEAACWSPCRARRTSGSSPSFSGFYKTRLGEMTHVRKFGGVDEPLILADLICEQPLIAFELLSPYIQKHSSQSQKHQRSPFAPSQTLRAQRGHHRR